MKKRASPAHSPVHADPGQKIKVALADPQPIVTYGLTSLLREECDIDVLFISHTAKHLLNTLSNNKVDVVICDNNFKDLLGAHGTQLFRLIHRHNPQTHIIYFTHHANTHTITEAMEAGAASVIRKSEEDLSLIIESLRHIYSGHFYLQSTLSQELLSHYLSEQRNKNPWNTLSAREKAVVQLICDGHSIKQIAHDLCKSPKTISNQKSTAMRKLNVTNDIQLVNTVKDLQEKSGN